MIVLVDGKACHQQVRGLHYTSCKDISAVAAASSLSLACAVAGSQFTGTAINPARALGPAVVFHCRWDRVWLYVIAGSSVNTA